MADTKKEHYVPRCYLENFENSDNRINVFDKIILQSRCQRKEEIAHENFFYDVDFEKMMSNAPLENQEKIKRDIKEITGIDDWDTIISTVLNPKYVEKEFLCKIEGVYSSLLKQIIENSYNGNQWVIDNCIPFSEDEKLLLSFFMSIQIIRTKAARNNLTQTYEKMIQTVLYKQQMNDENALPKEHFKIQSNKDFIKLQHLEMILDEEVALELADILSNHVWTMLVNKTDTPFYTSDNPVVTIPHKRDKYITYGGYGSEGVEVVFPLSPNLLIVMYEKRWYSSFIKDRTFMVVNKKDIIDYYNQAQIINSFRCVFSQKNNFDLALDVCGKYPEIRDPNNRVSVG